MDQAPVQIGQFILGKNLGIGAFGKVRIMPIADHLSWAGSLTSHNITQDHPMIAGISRLLVLRLPARGFLT
jgi:hypothetical protein